ncbi:hypothetical protein PAXINDRAFT_17481, partial [Paxillus involutus ATCC 200175]
LTTSLEPTARGSAEHSRRNLCPTLEPLDIELLAASFRDLQVLLDLSPYHPTSPTSRLSLDSCLPLDSHVSPNSRISPIPTRLSHLSPERDGHVTPAPRLSPVPTCLGLTSADGNISDSPGTPQWTAPDLLDLSPFVPGAFHHSTPLRNPLNTPLLSPGSPLSPLTPSSSGASSPDLVTQFDPLPALDPNHASVNSPAPPHPATISNGPRPSQMPENIPRAPNTPVPVAHPPPQPPMAAPFTMPLRGTKDTPKFQGKIIAELLRFLEDVGILADQAQLDHAGKIRAAIRYAALDEAELWETLESATAVPADWANFVTAIKQLYPGCEGADRYYRSDLHNLVQEYRVKPMKNREELGEYHRKFQKVAAHLISMDKLSVNERDLLFLDGLPHALAVPVRARLQYKVPDVHPSDPYPMASTLEAVNFSSPDVPATTSIDAAKEPSSSPAAPAQTTAPPATAPAPGTVMKQEYPAPGSQAARIATCAFCQDPSHFVPSCQLALAYINKGKLSRRNGRLCMPDGSPIPRIQGVYGMRNVVDHLLAQPAASTESASSSGFVRDPPPHITAALYTTAYGDDNSLEMELEVEPSAFLHTSSADLAIPDSSEVADPEFQAFLANAWANFQAGKGKGDQSKGKKMRFNGVEIPRRKAPRVTVKEEIESPAVREARAPGARKSSPLSQSTTPESLPRQNSPSPSSSVVIIAPSILRAPGEGQPIAKPMPTTARASTPPVTQQRKPVTSEHTPSKPATPAATAQPAATSLGTLNNGQFRYSFPLADSEAPKRALDQVLGVTVPVPLKELLALSPDLRKHMKEAVTGKRVWGNLLTQDGHETPDARAGASVHCFELEGRDPEGVAREYGPKLTYSDDGRIVGNHSIPLRYIEATIVGTG